MNENNNNVSWGIVLNFKSEHSMLYDFMIITILQ